MRSLLFRVIRSTLTAAAGCTAVLAVRHHSTAWIIAAVVLAAGAGAAIVWQLVRLYAEVRMLREVRSVLAAGAEDELRNGRSLVADRLEYASWYLAKHYGEAV